MTVQSALINCEGGATVSMNAALDISVHFLNLSKLNFALTEHSHTLCPLIIIAQIYLEKNRVFFLFHRKT